MALPIDLPKNFKRNPTISDVATEETPGQKAARGLAEKLAKKDSPILYNKKPTGEETPKGGKEPISGDTHINEYGEVEYNKVPNKVNAVSGLNEGFVNSWGEKGYKGSDESIKLRDKLLPLIKDKIDYLKSPEYKKRLVAMNTTENPNKLIQDRIKVIKNIQFSAADPKGASSTQYTPWSKTTDIGIVDDKDVMSTAAHEIGHATSTPSDNMKSVGDSTPRKMSAAEGWLFLNRQKGISKENKKNIESVIGAQNKKGVYPNDPGAQLSSLVGGDVHEIGASESKGDLESLRYLLKSKGYTKKYGEDLNMDKIKKAFDDKSVSNDDYIKRLRKRFTDEAIVELNNRVAKTDKKEKNDTA